MKIKHNKKRNTAFVFETLMREATAAILKGDEQRKDAVIKIVRTHFKSGTELNKHLECYKALYENQDISLKFSERILKEAKQASRLIDPHGLFKQQTELINDINKDLEPTVFNNFVPNYKTLATIDQIFSTKLPPKSRVMLENSIVENMSKSTEPQQPQAFMDNLVLDTFTEKFNEKYSKALSEEQKQLLSHYITSFADNAVELKTYLNEEIARLRAVLVEASKGDDFGTDESMKSKAGLIVEKLDTYAKTEINDNILLTVLKTQELAKELGNGNNN